MCLEKLSLDDLLNQMEYNDGIDIAAVREEIKKRAGVVNLSNVVSPLDVSFKNVARIKSYESLAAARKELLKNQELVVIDTLTGGNSCGTFLLHCLSKIYHTPKNVLDYINRYKAIIGNPPFGTKQ
jgi:hypothetical protein